MDPAEKEFPQVPMAGDFVHALTKGALSALPWVGGIFAETFALAVTSPVAARQARFFQALFDALAALARKVEGLTPESLATNEAFVSAMFQATRIAFQTHQKEKLDALRNAVLNVALGRAPDEDLQAFFMSYIEDLTPTHIRILRFFEAPSAVGADPLARIDFTTITLGGLLEETYPELRGREDFWGLIMDDLSRRGLVDPVDPTVKYSEDNRVNPILNSMGSQFLAFVRTPPELGAEPPAPR